MTTRSIVLPYNRNAIHIPRRDLVLGASDSLALEVSIISADDTTGVALDISGGNGGPGQNLYVWPWSNYSRSWDYGAWWNCQSSPLFVGTGTIGNMVGTFVIRFPPGTMASWPRRCAWSIQLDWNHGEEVSQLAWGILQVNPSGLAFVGQSIITTDAGEGIDTGSGVILGA
jgi:hypothetical protein